MAVQYRAPSSVNVTGTDRKIDTPLTRACSRDVRRQLALQRDTETDAEYGKRIYDYLNKHDIYAEKYK